MKPNQGTAPMDIENDEMDFEPRQIVEKVVNNSGSEKLPPSGLSLQDLYLMPTNSASYMFFPTGNATALMDPTTSAMMAAAMQQMQHYSNFSMPSEASGSRGVNGNGKGPDTTNNAGPYPISSGSAGSKTYKEIIKTKHCLLFPPNLDAPPPTIRERPLGCRTVFVGGLPENITEEIIREIFESCGEITTLRMSKKNFCHIRYRNEASIDRAIYLSGYRLRVTDSNDPLNYGRLHVDYAQARDDQYDYECKQRQLLREQRHRERIAHDRSQSPPPIPHYTDHEASIASEHLRNNETFLKSVQTITVWLERGDCNKRNANAFYSMIQSTHAHVRRLNADKQALEQDLRKARESYRKQMLTMSMQFTQIEKVFSAASHKKVWDHFTKAQRKNIDQWKKLASELRSVQIEDDEMEMSDDDCSSTKKARYDSDSLKEENDSLRCQLDAMRNEMSMNRTEQRHDCDFREKQIKVLQETIRNMQTKLMQLKIHEQKDTKSNEILESELKEARIRSLLLQTKIKDMLDKQREQQINSAYNQNMLNAEGIVTSSINEKHQRKSSEDNSNYVIQDENRLQIETPSKKPYTESEEKSESEIETMKQDQKYKEKLIKNTITNEQDSLMNKEFESLEKDESKSSCMENQKTNQPYSLELSEARIIALTTAFLIVQPHGASSESICEYLNHMIKSNEFNEMSIENMLGKYENLFKPIDLTPTVTASSKQCSATDVIRKWTFCGFI